MPACVGDGVHCGKYIKTVEASTWELIVVFSLMAAAVVFVIHFVFFAGKEDEKQPAAPVKKQPPPPIAAPRPRPAPVAVAPPPPPKQFADKGIQAPDEQIVMERQRASSKSRARSSSKSRPSSPSSARLAPTALKQKGTSSGFGKILNQVQPRRTILRI